MEILVKQNWNWNTCLIEIEIETEILCKTIIETELKHIANNGIEIETEISLITDTTLKQGNYKCIATTKSIQAMDWLDTFHLKQMRTWSRANENKWEW